MKKFAELDAGRGQRESLRKQREQRPNYEQPKKIDMQTTQIVYDIVQGATSEVQVMP